MIHTTEKCHFLKIPHFFDRISFSQKYNYLDVRNQENNSFIITTHGSITLRTIDPNSEEYILETHF